MWNPVNLGNWRREFPSTFGRLAFSSLCFGPVAANPPAAWKSIVIWNVPFVRKADSKRLEMERIVAPNWQIFLLQSGCVAVVVEDASPNS